WYFEYNLPEIVQLNSSPIFYLSELQQPYMHPYIIASVMRENSFVISYFARSLANYNTDDIHKCAVCHLVSTFVLFCQITTRSHYNASIHGSNTAITGILVAGSSCNSQ